ncbi:MAG: hypothetical protein QXZ09_09025 [Candidatus Methanomethylicaceae archaeon]
MIPLDTSQNDAQDQSKEYRSENADKTTEIYDDVPESSERGDEVPELLEVPDDIPEEPEWWYTVYPWGSREAMPSPEGEPRCTPYPERESPPIEERPRRGIEFH